MSTHPTRDTHARETEHESELADGVERVVSTLFDVGRLWASHGLSVGRSALETSAVTLRTTADLLGELSDRFRRDEAPEEPADERAA
jgi:hypothetical protein